MNSSSSLDASATGPEPGSEAGAAETRPLPFVLGVVGDSGSGKSTICNAVRALLGPDQVADLKLDDYLRFTREERAERGVTALDPEVHDFALMRAHLELLRSGREVRVRSYEHADGSFGSLRTVEPREVVLVRGLLGFPSDELRAAYDLTVFLYPEPELLFRWKLRRDVRTRGYTEAQVLKNIAQHLLDSKEFVLPQAARADVVVRYALADWSAPDSEVVATLTLRRRAAEALEGAIASLDRFGDAITVTRGDDAVELHLATELPREEVDAWATERFPAYDAARIGSVQDDVGGRDHRAQLAFIEVLIARLTQKLRQVDGSG